MGPISEAGGVWSVGIPKLSTGQGEFFRISCKPESQKSNGETLENIKKLPKTESDLSSRLELSVKDLKIPITRIRERADQEGR
jgi:hypothetical protein